MIPITISIDDVNPQEGWRILGDKAERWLRNLNEEFGAKFTCFVPSNYHGKFPLSEHKEWVQEMASIPWIELAAHGHFHMTSDPKRFGECEMLELDTAHTVQSRIFDMEHEWGLATDYRYIPSGWKNPGWVCHYMFNDVFRYKFRLSGPYFASDYVSLHYEHNQGMQWNCKTFFGHDGIQETNIQLHNISDTHPEGMIMLTSHIAGDWNDNVWNERNYEQLRLSLTHLVENYNCGFKTLKECLN